VTLILNQVGWQWALQVSDRLVSRITAGTPTPFDTASNKTIVLLTRTGIVCLSYCGLSYINARPTDSWLVEQIRQEPIEHHPGGRPVTARIGPQPRFPSLQSALGRIQAGLTATLGSGRSRTQVGVIGAGWLMYRAKRPRPIAVAVVPGANGYVVQWSQRIYGRRFLSLPIPPGYLSQQEAGHLASRLAPCGLEEAEAEMASTIAQVAARSPGVGADCMSVAISPPRAGNSHVRVRYLPSAPSAGVLHGGPAPINVEVSYGPWFLGPDLYMAPTIMTAGGRTELQLGAFHVVIEGPAGGEPGDDDPGIMLFHSQHRPRRP